MAFFESFKADSNSLASGPFSTTLLVRGGGSSSGQEKNCCGWYKVAGWSTERLLSHPVIKWRSPLGVPVSGQKAAGYMCCVWCVLHCFVYRAPIRGFSFHVFSLRRVLEGDCLPSPSSQHTLSAARQIVGLPLFQIASPNLVSCLVTLHCYPITTRFHTKCG